MTCTSGSRRRSRQAGAGFVMCHVSHLYRTGASLYFTFLARQEPGARDRAVADHEDAPPPMPSWTAAAR